MKITKKEEKRFWSKVDKSGFCWEWTACKTFQGYGHSWMSGKNQKAHRIAWALTHRYCPIPPGMCVLHACDNPSCVNPRHLFLGTNADNVQNRESKGRSAGPKGESNCKSKLTISEVLEIRSKYIPRKYTQPELAKEYGVTKSEIYRIIRREVWAHI